MEQDLNYIPYLSIAKLERVLELTRTRTMSKISTSLFANYGFNTTDAALAVKLLKFLGAVDEEGNPTKFMNDLRLESEEKRKQAFENIVRNSYNKLFAAVKKPQNLSQGELADEFRVQYNQSPRVIGTAIPVFIKLCEYAGLKEPGTVVTKTHKPREQKTVTTAKKQRAEAVSTNVTSLGIHSYPIVKGKMDITVPEEIFLRSAVEDELNDDWRTVLKVAHKFADKYLKNNPGAEV